MGYRFGKHTYGEHLYSRWPDWWELTACENDDWTVKACTGPGWVQPTPPPRETWVPITPDAPVWIGPGTPVPTPHPRWRQ